MPSLDKVVGFAKTAKAWIADNSPLQRVPTQGLDVPRLGNERIVKIRYNLELLINHPQTATTLSFRSLTPMRAKQDAVRKVWIVATISVVALALFIFIAVKKPGVTTIALAVLTPLSAIGAEGYFLYKRHIAMLELYGDSINPGYLNDDTACNNIAHVYKELYDWMYPDGLSSENPQRGLRNAYARRMLEKADSIHKAFRKSIGEDKIAVLGSCAAQANQEMENLLTLCGHLLSHPAPLAPRRPLPLPPPAGNE